MKNSIQQRAKWILFFFVFFFFLVKNRIMKTVKKNQCLLGKYTDYFFAPIVKKIYILGGGEAGGGEEIPMLLKLSKVLKKIQTKNQSN